MCGAPKAYCDDDFKRCMLKLCSTDYKKNKQCPQAAEVIARMLKHLAPQLHVLEFNSLFFCVILGLCNGYNDVWSRRLP